MKAALPQQNHEVCVWVLAGPRIEIQVCQAASRKVEALVITAEALECLPAHEQTVALGERRKPAASAGRRQAGDLEQAIAVALPVDTRQQAVLLGPGVA